MSREPFLYDYACFLFREFEGNNLRVMVGYIVSIQVPFFGNVAFRYLYSGRYENKVYFFPFV